MRKCVNGFCVIGETLGGWPWIRDSSPLAVTRYSRYGTRGNRWEFPAGLKGPILHASVT